MKPNLRMNKKIKQEKRKGKINLLRFVDVVKNCYLRRFAYGSRLEMREAKEIAALS